MLTPRRHGLNGTACRIGERPLNAIGWLNCQQYRCLLRDRLGIALVHTSVASLPRVPYVPNVPGVSGLTHYAGDSGDPVRGVRHAGFVSVERQTL